MAKVKNIPRGAATRTRGTCVRAITCTHGGVMYIHTRIYIYTRARALLDLSGQRAGISASICQLAWRDLVVNPARADHFWSALTPDFPQKTSTSAPARITRGAEFVVNHRTPVVRCTLNARVCGTQRATATPHSDSEYQDLLLFPSLSRVIDAIASYPRARQNPCRKTGISPPSRSDVSHL